MRQASIKRCTTDHSKYWAMGTFPGTGPTRQKLWVEGVVYPESIQSSYISLEQKMGEGTVGH